MLALLESHPLAAAKNDFDFICAVRGANSARLFDCLNERLLCRSSLSFFLPRMMGQDIR